ncbi:hypothetical protein HAX54_017303, partial [Datura stramonium]|nr:hypothetical protein [Datura stramonium]
ISMQDKMVIYDNEKQAIGWSPANCDRPPKSSKYDNNPNLSNYTVDRIDSTYLAHINGSSSKMSYTSEF